jgi:hypothetical protein
MDCHGPGCNSCPNSAVPILGLLTRGVSLPSSPAEA